MDKEDIVTGFLITGTLIMVVGAGFVGQTAQDHEYEVKTEQVETDAGYDTEQAVPIENLTQDEQRALQEAYRQSDHFLGSASVTIKTDERLDLNRTSSWLVVEVEGVHLLTSIHHVGAEEYNKWNRLTGIVMGLGALVFSVGMALMIIDVRWGL